MFAGLPGNPATGVSGIFPTPPTFIWLARKMPGCLTFRCRKYRLFLQIRRQLDLPRYPASIKILVFPSEFKFVLAVFASMTWFTLPICNTFNQSLIHRNKTLPFCQINLRYLIPLKHPATVFGCRTTWLDMTSDCRISRCGVVGFYRKHDWNGLYCTMYITYSTRTFQIMTLHISDITHWHTVTQAKLTKIKNRYRVFILYKRSSK